MIVVLFSPFPTPPQKAEEGIMSTKEKTTHSNEERKKNHTLIMRKEPWTSVLTLLTYVCTQGPNVEGLVETQR